MRAWKAIVQTLIRRAGGRSRCARAGVPGLLGVLLATGLPAKEVPPAVNAWLEGARTLGSRSSGNLCIVPVTTRGGAAPGGLLSMDEAMAAGHLVVTETSASGTVNTLLLRNGAERPVFIMAGEILAGAKQDRILQQDLLLPPRSAAIPVAAFCVEHGRWAAKSETFFSERKSAPLGVRQRAAEHKEQGAVWDEVSANNARLGVAPATGTLSAAHEAPKMKAQRGSYLGAFSGLPGQFPRATGAVVLVNGRVMAADLFGDRVLFERLWGKLLDSYIAEAVRRQEEAVSSSFNSAEAFLARAAQAGVDLAPGPAAGQQVTVEAAGLRGGGVVLGNPVHLGLFPAGAATAPGRGLARNYGAR
ncbi:MAG: hypothetical protein HY823_11295 [Acidobacteria bacterium]|nr:hypothetical protein [Acidobacteriota bacterium]